MTDTSSPALRPVRVTSPEGAGRPSTSTVPPGSVVVACTVSVPPVFRVLSRSFPGNVASVVVAAYRRTEVSYAGYIPMPVPDTVRVWVGVPTAETGPALQVGTVAPVAASSRAAAASFIGRVLASGGQGSPSPWRGRVDEGAMVVP